MNFSIAALLVFIVSGCTQTINTRRQDFSPSERKGVWTDYYRSVKKGETPEPPKEVK